MLTMLCIDPGLGGTGVAKVLCEVSDHGLGFVSLGWNTVRLSTKQNYLTYIADCLEGVEYVIIEDAEYMRGDKGQVAAKADSLVKLAKLIGSIEGLLLSKNIPYDILKPREWKGQTSKETTKKRIKEATGLEPKSHAADAVGIGLWKCGLINKDVKDRCEHYRRTI